MSYWNEITRVKFLNTLPMRNWNKNGEWGLQISPFYLIHYLWGIETNKSDKKSIHFWFLIHYLWGIETDLIDDGGYLAPELNTLPMRNWNTNLKVTTSLL